jgi:integration host factor subunit beta
LSKAKFTRERIQKILCSGAGMDLARARAITARIIDEMASALAAGETIELRGLGTLEIRNRAGWMVRIPASGEPVAVPSRKTVFFRPSRELKRALNREGRAKAAGRTQ